MFPEVKVVGMHFRGPDAVELAAQLEPGTILRLEREPDNAFDPFAIKVFFEAVFIGYIERGQAAWISPRMEDGEDFVAEVDRVEPIAQRNGKVNHHPVVTVRHA